MRLEMMGDKQRFEFAESTQSFCCRPLRGQNCSIANDAIIGPHTTIGDNVVIKAGVIIGDYCNIKSGSVIGDKGFSFGFNEDGMAHEIVHTGGVIIGNHVEIGALCTVCRGTVTDTIIENYVKTDDHVHIAHNCHIKKGVIITAGAILGGSVTIEPKSWLGLNCTVQNKVKLAWGTLVGTAANVIKNTVIRAVMTGNPAKIMRVRRYET